MSCNENYHDTALDLAQTNIHRVLMAAEEWLCQNKMSNEAFAKIQEALNLADMLIENVKDCNQPYMVTD